MGGALSDLHEAIEFGNLAKIEKILDKAGNKAAALLDAHHEWHGPALDSVLFRYKGDNLVAIIKLMVCAFSPIASSLTRTTTFAGEKGRKRSSHSVQVWNVLAARARLH